MPSCRGPTCSTYADCRAKLEAGESIAYQGQLGSFMFSASNTPTASGFTVAHLANGNFVVAKTVNLDITAMQAAHAAELATASAVQTTRIQQGLTALGFYSGPIDGQTSDALTASIAALQQQLGLPATGVYDAETDAALRQKLGTAGQAVNEATISLQQALKDRPTTDPSMAPTSAATVAGVRGFQASIGVPQTGIVDAATLKAIFALGAAVRAAALRPSSRRRCPPRCRRRNLRRRRRRASRRPNCPRLRRHRPPMRRRRRHPAHRAADGAAPAPERQPDAPPTTPPATTVPTTIAPSGADQIVSTLDPRWPLQHLRLAAGTRRAWPAPWHSSGR